MTSATLTAGDWHAMLRIQSGSSIPFVRSALPYTIASFDSLPREFVQPSLADDVLCLHRVGPKRVHRLRDSHLTTYDVDARTMTLLPRGRPASWKVEGPMGHLQLVLSPKVLNDVIGEECCCSREDFSFIDAVGFRKPLLASLIEEMLRVSEDGDESLLYAETLQSAVILALIRHARERRHGCAGDELTISRGGLAAWRLRKVLEYMAEHRSTEVDYDSVVSVSGVSRAHFYRAFRQSTGTTPARHLEKLRVEQARHLIEAGHPLAHTAASAGFASRAAMTRAFRRVMNITPEVYRHWYK